MPRPGWPAEQEDLLRRLLPTTPIPDIARLLGRSIHAVHAKRRAMEANGMMPRRTIGREEKMMRLTERIEQCRSFLNMARC